jgi:hypothetical protein
VATGWTECFPLLVREGMLVVQAIERAQSLFPWLIRGLDFDNDSAFMNDVVVPWCRAHGIEVTRSRAYKKNDQAFVEQKNGAVVRRLVGYGRFEGIEAARELSFGDAEVSRRGIFSAPLKGGVGTVMGAVSTTAARARPAPNEWSGPIRRFYS